MDAILIRHGEKQTAPAGQDSLIDPVLTDTGARQAIEAGIVLRQREHEDLGDHPMLDYVGDVCASPYKRTIQTAIFALAQIQDRGGDVTATLILEPLLSESFTEGQRCEGSTKTALIQWIYDEGPNGLTQTVIDGFHANMDLFPNQAAYEEALERALSIIHHIDLSRMRYEQWWPQQTETQDDVALRVKQLNHHDSGWIPAEREGRRLYFTHSTLIADLLQAQGYQQKDIYEAQAFDISFGDQDNPAVLRSSVPLSSSQTPIRDQSPYLGHAL